MRKMSVLVLLLAGVVCLVSPPAAARALSSKLAFQRSAGKTSRRQPLRPLKRPGARARRTASWPPLRIASAHTGEVLTLPLYQRGGRLDRLAAKRLARLARCRRTGRWRALDPQLLANLYRVYRDFGGRLITMYSGFRHRSVSWHRESRHTKGRAIDFSVEGVSARQLRDYALRTFASAGVGYYPHTPFVHMDVRGRAAFWVDFSGPGETPRYAKDPYRLLALDRRGDPIDAYDPALTRREEEAREEEDGGAAPAPQPDAEPPLRAVGDATLASSPIGPGELLDPFEEEELEVIP